MKRVVSLTFFAFIASAIAISCPPDYCNTVDCAPQPKCASDEVLQPGFCGCCLQCTKILKENDRCHLFAVGGPPPKAICEPGLICKDGKCQKNRS